MPSIERITLGDFLSSMPPEERQEILVTMLYFYQLGVIRNGQAEPGTSARDIPGFLDAHPRRAELYPNLDAIQITTICEQLSRAYALLGSMDADTDPDAQAAQVNPFEFAVGKTSFIFAENTAMFRVEPLSINRLSPQSASTVVRAIASALRPNVRGLISAETPR